MGSVLNWALLLLSLIASCSHKVHGQVGVAQGPSMGNNLVPPSGGGTTDTLVAEYEETLKKAQDPSIHENDWCIVEVPPIFNINNDSFIYYSPQVMAIGARYYEQRNQFMERRKFLYVKNFLDRQPNYDVSYYIQSLRGIENRARNCYSQPYIIPSDNFVNVLLMDGLFTIEFMFQSGSPDQRQNNDSIFSTIWMGDSIRNDMKLVENQIPFFVLEHLFNITNSKGTKYGGKSLLEIIKNFFEDDLRSGLDNCLNIYTHQWNSLVDVFRQCYVPSKPRLTPKADDFQGLPSATELHEVGIKLAKDDLTDSFLDASFRKGVLRIPPLEVKDNTELMLRNIIVMEHYTQGDAFITDYVALMDALINTPDDVAVLRDADIISSRLGRDEDVALLFNNLGKGITLRKFFYAKLSEDVNRKFKVRWSYLITVLKREYFDTPWKITAFIVALVLLICSLIQTYFTCRPRNPPTSSLRQTFSAYLARIQKKKPPVEETPKLKETPKVSPDESGAVVIADIA